MKKQVSVVGNLLISRELEKLGTFMGVPRLSPSLGPLRLQILFLAENFA